MTVRVGIIGTGGISRAHQQTYEKVGGFEIVAVCDIIKSKANQAADDWGVPRKHAFSSYNKMLEMDEIDAVSVCTYNQGHRRPTVAALNAGKHVLCEKPMAATLPDATAMVRAAKATGKILQIGLNPTFSPRLQFARKMVDAGLLGDIYYSESAGCRRRGIQDIRSSTKRQRARGRPSILVSTICIDRCMRWGTRNPCASPRSRRITSRNKIRGSAVSWMSKSSE